MTIEIYTPQPESFSDKAIDQLSNVRIPDQPQDIIETRDQPWDIMFLTENPAPCFSDQELANLKPEDVARYPRELLLKYTPDELDRQVYCEMVRPLTDPIYTEGLRLSRERYLAERRYDRARMAQIALLSAHPEFRPSSEDYFQSPRHDIAREFEEAAGALAVATQNEVDFRGTVASVSRDDEIRHKQHRT